MALEREAGERGYVVDDAMGKVGRGADEQDGVTVDEAGDGGEGYTVGGRWAGDKVGFDFEVRSRFAKGRVGGFREYPEGPLAMVWMG